jgi:GABA(A) receptor-associated protein
MAASVVRSLGPGEATRILAKYPDKVPVVVERARGCQAHIPELARWKYLVARSMTVGQFLYVIRRHMTLPPEQALFLFIGNTLPLSSAMLVEVWHQHAGADGALHVVYSGEATFGR